MIIRLPERFMYTTRNPDNYAYVSEGELYIHGYVNFEDLMYSLSYTLKGYSHCYYCGKVLTPSNRTLDHVYPRSWGGISLPDNLEPSCKACNGLKADMTLEQFNKLKKLPNSKKQNAFHTKCVKENEKIIQTGAFILPSNWVTMYDSSAIINNFNFDLLDKSKMKKLSDYYNRIQQYPHPIVVSSNGWVFKGKHILCHARKIHQPIVPAIVLDNVVVIRNTS